ncbi:MAG: ester cyclase [Chloroflexi bacterium]|nr:ester cyclase [Chloroflexota bacterium]
MTESLAQSNREIIHAHWTALNESDPGRVPGLVDAATRADIAWHGPAPYNDIHGVDALVEQFWQPLLRAFPDLQRNTDVLIAGAYRDQNWVSGSGYFTGTFVNDWNGIAATGEKTMIRFGEIMALEAGKVVKTYLLLDFLDVMQQGGFQLGWPAPAIEGLRPKVKIGSGVLRTEQDPVETRKTLLLVEAMLFGLVRKDQPMALYWHPDMIWNSPSGVGSARSLAEFLDKVHEVFLNGLSGTWAGSHNARYAEGRFAVSTGWPSLVAVHDGDFLSIPASGNTLCWRIMDFWERSEDLLTTNWVHIDMINIFKQMGVDVFALYQAYREEHGL